MPPRVSFAGACPEPLAVIRVDQRRVPAIGSLLNVAHQTPTLPLRSTWAARHATRAAKRLENDLPAPRLLALVDVLFQPSLDGLPTVPYVTAHSVADWAVALIPPAVQGVDGYAQHFRDIRHDINLSRASSVMIIFFLGDG